MTYTVALLASKQRQVKRGVKEVVKAIRKGEKGYVAPTACLNVRV